MEEANPSLTVCKNCGRQFQSRQEFLGHAKEGYYNVFLPAWVCPPDEDEALGAGASRCRTPGPAPNGGGAQLRLWPESISRKNARTCGD